jgi:flavin reductase (DIM6/NTAB) family NADH-FMN oxidoreductase RutF
MTQIDNFKKSMANFVTGITVITTTFEDKPIGITVNSFNSVSLEPSLILFSLEKKSARYAKFINQKFFTVNILSESQKNLSELFAWHKEVDWKIIKWHHSKNNDCPILDNCSAYLDCEIYQIHEGGDHSIIVAKVINSEALDFDPLIYHRRKYKKLGDDIN